MLKTKKSYPICYSKWKNQYQNFKDSLTYHLFSSRNDFTININEAALELQSEDKQEKIWLFFRYLHYPTLNIDYLNWQPLLTIEWQDGDKKKVPFNNVNEPPNYYTINSKKLVKVFFAVAEFILPCARVQALFGGSLLYFPNCEKISSGKTEAVFGGCSMAVIKL